MDLSRSGKKSMEQIMDEIMPDDRKNVIKGIAWTVTDKGFACPVVIIRDAYQLSENMKAWCQDQVSEWFTVKYHRGPKGVTFQVVPNLQKSISRWTQNAKNNGIPVDDDTKFMIVYKPLDFFSESADNFDQAAQFFGDTMEVRLLEEEFVKEGAPFSPDLIRHAIYLGDLRVARMSDNEANPDRMGN
jgi:hypothetical protein